MYDLNGKWQGKNIPLANNSPKGVFKIDATSNVLTIAVTPFQEECKYVVWQQDMEGNMIKGIDAKSYAVVPEFSNEVNSYGNTSSFDIHLFYEPPVADTLYHYNAESNKLIPVFNVDLGAKSNRYKNYHY